MRKCRLTNGRLTRWALTLQEFDLEIQHVSGKNNIVANTLTRYPRENEERSEPKIKLNIIKETKYSTELNTALKYLTNLQQSDDQLKRIIKPKNEHITKKNDIIFSRSGPYQQWRTKTNSKITHERNT